MARPRRKQPTDGELEILSFLWDEGPAELGRICAAIRARRQVATTTVATMLKVMMDKGLVKRSAGDRGYLWSARVSRKVAIRGLVGGLLERLFDGSVQGLLSHLIDDGRLGEQEREAILRMLSEAEEEEPGES